MCGRGGGSPCRWICGSFSNCVLECNYNINGVVYPFLFLTFFNWGVKLSSTIIIIAKKNL